MSTSLLFFLTTTQLVPAARPAPLDPHNNSPGQNLESRPICPFPRCPDPVNASPEIPCGSCNASKCKYEGCVYFGVGFSWKPDNCTTCHCEGGVARCIAHSCQPVNCYGSPKMRRPNECCEECDYGARLSECKLVTKDIVRVFYAHDYLQTCRQLRKHKCDKSYAVDEENNWYRCTEVEGKVQVSENPGCEHLTGEGEEYTDNVMCKRELIMDNTALPQDYDFNPVCIPLPPE